MLKPFIPSVADMIPPANLFTPEPLSHFGRRARQRGVVSIPGDLLHWAVERALLEGRAHAIDLVFNICPTTAVYRILLPEGSFYPVVRDGSMAVTIYCQRQMQMVRKGRALRKKHQGNRLRRDVKP